MTMIPARSGRALGIATCCGCGEVIAINACNKTEVCPHCRSVVRPWWKASAEPSWFLFLGGLLALYAGYYQPAFAYLSVARLHYPMTFLGAVTELFQQGAWEFAAVVFFTTFIVPCLRAVALAGLLCADDLGLNGMRRGRTRVLRSLRWLGRWAFLEVLTVAILVYASAFGSRLSLLVGSGLWLYAVSSVLMLAATLAFDGRRIWG